MFTLSFLVIICVLLIIVYLYKNTRAKPENFPPGPPALPIWGSYWFMLKENYKFSHLAMETLGRRYKTDILGFVWGDFNAVVTLSYDLCKELLIRDEFIGRPDTVITRARSFGERKGIFFVDGPFWKEQRRFSLRHMRDFGFGRRSDTLENFQTDEIKSLIDFLNSETGKTTDPDICKGKGHVLLPDLFYGPMLNSILSLLVSAKFDNDKLRVYSRRGLKFLRSEDSTGGAIIMTPWLRFFAPEFFGYTSAVEDTGFIQDFLKIVLDDHIKTFSDDHHRDFIDVYLSETYREGYELDYNQLLMLVLDYMFPAPIAVGQTLTFYFAYLINNPDVQSKIHEEIDRVVGRSQLPTLDDRKSMPYLEASIREIIRIIPLTPLGVVRRCVKDTMLGGYFIPKDTLMLANLWTAHKDEKVWKDPELFQPERFLDEKGNLLKKDWTIGFGAGKRLCAGETFARNSLFMVAAALLQNFTIKSPDGKPMVFDLVPGITLSLKQGHWILTVPR